MPYRASPTRRLKMIGIDTKKDVGVSTSRPSQVSGSRIAYAQRIDNTDSGSPDKLGGKILNFPEKVIPLCHE